MKKNPTKMSLVSTIRAKVLDRLKRLTRKEIIYLVGGFVLLLIAGLGAILLSDHFDWKGLSQKLAGFDPVVAVLLMAVLPLVGFPISVVYLAIGARFGPLVGLPILLGITAFHLGVTYWITGSFLRKPLDRLIARRGYHLPEFRPGEQVGAGLIAILIPGLPYIVRNYLIVLTDIPLLVIFGVCVPLYVARSYVTIMMGDFATNPTAPQLLLLAAVFVLELVICAYLIWHLHQRRQAALGVEG